MINTQVLKGNLIRQDYTTAFVLNQGDKGVPFKIELLENGAPYILQNTDIVAIEWYKPNGNPFLQDTGITKGDTYIEITTPEAISQSSGSGTFNIIISDGTTRKGTIKREYKVVSTSLRPGSVSEGVITDAITELRNLNTKLAETVQNNQTLINNNSAATKSDIASVNSSLEDNVKYRNQGGFNLLEQGGKNDGITDNTPILQSLINTLSVMGGGNIYIPDGTYFFGRTGTTDYAINCKSNVNIYGSGIGKTVLKTGYGDNKDGEGYSLFYFIKSPSASTPVFIENCTYKDFTVDGYNMIMSQYTHKGKAFYMQNIRNAIFENLELKGLPSTALGIDFLHNVHISKIHCYECGRLWEEQWVYDGVTKGRGPGGAGIGIGTGNLVDENFTISDCITDKCGHFGIFLEHQGIFNYTWHNKDARGVTISNCITKNSRYGGLGLRGGTNITINGCESYGNKYGVRLDSGGGEGDEISIVKFKNCKVINSTFSDNTSDGVIFTGDINSDTFAIENNIITGNGRDGISLGLNGKTNLINKFTSINNNKIISNANNGILVENGIGYENLTINNNDVVGNGAYGIYVNDALLTYTTITENDLIRNSVQSMYIAKSSITSTTQIVNNLVEASEYILETPPKAYATFPSSLLKNNGSLTIRLKFKVNAFDTVGEMINPLISTIDESSNGTYARGFILSAKTTGVTLYSSDDNSNSSYNELFFAKNLETNIYYNMLINITSDNIAISIDDEQLESSVVSGALSTAITTLLNAYSYNSNIYLSYCKYKQFVKSATDIDFNIFNIVSNDTYQYNFNNIGINKTIIDVAYGIEGKAMYKAKQNYLLN